MSTSPGILVLVVGPSGAGKDTVLRDAAALLRDEPSIVFPRRYITRPSDTSEHHIAVCTDEFARLAAMHAFALTWTAHELHYGIPTSIQYDIQAGCMVVCNVSRTIVSAARETFARVRVVEITAEEATLAARLRGRGREPPSEIGARLLRTRAAFQFSVDTTVRNDGAPEIAALKFAALLTDWLGSG